MRLRGSARTTIDLKNAEPAVRRLLEALIDGRELTVAQDGKTLGTLTFRPDALSGTVHMSDEPDDRPAPPVPEGFKVLVTTMRLSQTARRRLSDSMGPDYIVVDFADAPSTADVLLTHPGSPQLLGRLRVMFPHAQLIVTEIYDPELGVDVSGPVGRLLDAGAQAYLPSRPVEMVAENVRAYLSSVQERQLERGSTSAAAGFLMPPAGDGQPVSEPGGDCPLWKM